MLQAETGRAVAELEGATAWTQRGIESWVSLLGWMSLRVFFLFFGLRGGHVGCLKFRVLSVGVYHSSRSLLFCFLLDLKV